MDNYLPTTRMFIDCANYQMPTLQIKDISGQNIPLKTTEQGELIVFSLKFPTFNHIILIGGWQLPSHLR